MPVKSRFNAYKVRLSTAVSLSLIQLFPECKIFFTFSTLKGILVIFTTLMTQATTTQKCCILRTICAISDENERGKRAKGKEKCKK